MHKKEIKLYESHKKKWDIYKFIKITISYQDSENLIKCNEFLIDKECTILKRETKRFKLFDRFVYINKLYAGKDNLKGVI